MLLRDDARELVLLGMEDLRRDHGSDDDFNDLVIDYNLAEVTDAAGRVKQIDGSLSVKAIGAALRNGFAIGLPVAAGGDESVSRTLSGSEITGSGLTASGGRSLLSVFEDPRSLLQSSTVGFVNTEAGEGAVASDTLYLSVVLSGAQYLEDLAPYDPFIVIGGDEQMEVHLPGREPSVRARLDLLNTGDDASESSGYYRTASHLSWAINLVSSWQHPLERVPLVQAYPDFAAWAASAGAEYANWYSNSRSGLVFSP